MNVNSLPSSYTAEALSTGSSWDQTAVQQMIQASVSTRKVGVNLGSFGLEYSSQDVSYQPRPTPQTASFDQELELFRLSQHITPFTPAGAYAQNASIQRQGAAAYAQQASMARQPNPMISVLV